jgi:hypothetical protein
VTLIPRISGAASIRTPAAAFLLRFRDRVEAGLLTGRKDRRANYAVARAEAASLRVRAADWPTAVNVGLNEIELDVGSGEVRYRIHYWRWAAFALALSGLIGSVGLILLLAFDARGYIAANQNRMLPGLTVDQNLGVAWAMVIFWGFLWPWLLIRWHRRPLHDLIQRIIREVDADGQLPVPRFRP